MSIDGHRSHAEAILEDNPSLKPQKATILREAYARARKGASAQTGMLVSVFPEECPFTMQDIERFGWMPPDVAGTDPVGLAVAGIDSTDPGLGDPDPDGREG